MLGLNLRRLVIALTAVLFAAVVVYEVAQYRSDAESLVHVVAAAADLPARAVLVESDLTTAQIPRYAAPPGAIGNVRDIVGRVLRYPALRGEAIVEGRLASAGSERSASLLLPPDKPYAFNLPISLFLSAPPRLQVHDRIDIIGYPRGRPIGEGGVIVANLEVIDISPRTTDNVSDSAFLTVAATSDEIVRVLAAREGLSLAIALRPFAAPRASK